jgi:hypothetical protein
VGTHRDVVAGQELHDLDLLLAALEFHHSGAAFLHQAHRVGKRQIARWITHERQVGDQERTLQATRHGCAVVDHVVHGDGHGGGVSLDHHAERVSNQHHIDAAGVEQCREAGIIRGQAGNLLTALLHLIESTERDRRPVRVTQLQLGIHDCS